MLSAFLLGLVGSVTHCVGMCSGVMLLLGRRQGATGWRLLVLHAGRLTTYAVLGALVAALGHALSAAAGAHTHHHGAGGHGHAALLPGLAPWQGALSLVAAAIALYMALAVLGRAPSPELLLARATRWWGRTARKFTQPARSGTAQSGPARDGLHLYLSGLFWGLLPCGLVMAGLLLAAAAGSVFAGALTMLAFGIGTLPMGLGVSWAGRQIRPSSRWAAWLRPAAAAIILLFGVQMALRGLAAWGWVAHGHIGVVPLW